MRMPKGRVNSRHLGLIHKDDAANDIGITVKRGLDHLKVIKKERQLQKLEKNTTTTRLETGLNQPFALCLF